MTGDLVQRAKAALEGVTEGPWIYIAGDDEEASVISEGEQLPDAITVGGITFNPGYSVAVDLRNSDAELIAAARSLIPELIAEVEKLRMAEVERMRTEPERKRTHGTPTATQSAREANHG